MTVYKNRILFAVSIYALLASTHCTAQLGCKDPQATNFNNLATINDGSCVYATTSFVAPLIDSLPNTLNEISGMVFYNNNLYAHNDGGNSSTIFKLDTFGKIIARINLPSTSNTDWEDLTQDATHFYIADVGNNQGNRTDLKIYKFPKSIITADTIITVPDSLIERIAFAYADQTDFTSATNNNKFDCEAILYKNGLLHLFTKNWVNSICVHYTLPIIAGTYTATRVDSLNGQGILITGANEMQNNIVLCGYQAGATVTCAIWFVYDLDSNANNFLQLGNKRKLDFGTAFTHGQIETICFKNKYTGYLSNEKFNPIAPVNIAAQLWSFNVEPWFPNYALSAKPVANNTFSFFVLPTHLIIESNTAQKLQIKMYSASGSIVYSNTNSIHSGTNSLTLPALPYGVYTAIITNNNYTQQKIFVIGN